MGAEIPNLLIVCMEDVGSIFVDCDAVVCGDVMPVFERIFPGPIDESLQQQ